MQSYDFYEADYKKGGPTKRNIVRLFDSLEDFMEYGRQRGTHDLMTNERFVGRKFSDYNHAEDDARTAWQEGLDIVESVAEQLAKQIDKPTKRRRRRKWKQDGDSVCVDRILDNRDKVWASHTQVDKSAPRSIEIVFEFNASAGTPWRDIINRAAVAIAVCDVLEEAGYGVTLHAMIVSGDMYRTTKTEEWANAIQNIVLKPEGVPLDKSTIVNAVSGWCYRSLGFRTMSAFPECCDKVSPGLGRVLPITKERAGFVVENADNTIILTGSYDLRINTELAISRLKEIGVVK